MLKAALKSYFNYDIGSKKASSNKNSKTAVIHILSDKSYASGTESALKKILKDEDVHVETMAHLDFSARQYSFASKEGCLLVLFASENSKKDFDVFNVTPYSWGRDRGSWVLSQLKQYKTKDIELKFESKTLASYDQAIEGFAAGLELAAYNFMKAFKKENTDVYSVKVANGSAKTAKAIEAGQQAAVGIQIARHLVNLPPNLCNPDTIAKAAKNELGFSKNSVVTIWNKEKCQKEGMNLLLAVGQGAETPPCMVHIKYRPTKKSKEKPIAFVGKGVTFDTGGLDIKPSSGMRLMKKDMGGSAAVLGLAHWVDQVGYPHACDFYLALAENAVSDKAMRPSDVYQSRAGFFVEIDNTDAEGRLVMADVMDVAITATEKPKYLIDVATLTGAIKVGLGAEVAGLFSNNKKLAHEIFEAGDSAGEPNWIMPLVQKYWNSHSSNFADFKNSASEGFGGAITAALFLQKFAKDTPWAHLDVYAWNDRTDGAYTQSGGSGQPVQTLIQFLKEQA